MMCALTIAIALTQTAFRLRFDSVLLTSFFHASINTHALALLPMLVIGVSPVLGGATGIVLGRVAVREPASTTMFRWQGIELLPQKSPESRPRGALRARDQSLLWNHRVERIAPLE